VINNWTAVVLGGAFTLVLVSAVGQTPKSHMSVHDQAGLVDQYCSDCHNADLKSGNLSLSDLNLDHPERNIDVAEKVIRKVGVAMMPPPGKARPSPEVLKLFVSSLASNIDTAAALHPIVINPALHRLNRTEYANSVRDLLGVEVDADKLLPPDALSHGFDNMAGVLTLSPALMGAYVSAAGRISRLAVGDRNAVALTSTYDVPRVISQEHHIEGTPMGTRGGISVVHDFPADGKYTFKVSFFFSLDGPIFGALQAKKEQLEISVNGFRIALIQLNPKITKFDDIHTPPIDIKAGPQRISAAFIKTADGPVEDSVEPTGMSLIDLNQATLAGLTKFPHLHELSIIGPTQVSGISETPSRKIIFSCYPKAKSEETPCARKIVSRLAIQAYRRPVTSEEVSGLMKLYEVGYADGGFEGGVNVAVQAILASPSFIYRFERNRAQIAQHAAADYAITDLELASRLSYFLWSAPPDRTLLTLAEENRLHLPGTLRTQVKRMLADPRSNSLSTNFAGEWLHLQNLKAALPDAYLFPNYDKNLGNSMRKETELLFNSVVHDDQSVLTLLNANYTYVNGPLAQLYGIPNILGNRFRRVELTDQNRFGLLGQASILTLTSASNRTSPVMRGKYVMEVFLGTPPPPPPAAQQLPEHGSDGSVQTVRERLEEHRRNPTCAGCHKFMDPIGFALENFDPIGGWRTLDAGTPIDSSGQLYDGTKLNSPSSLRKALLVHSDAFLGTFTENLFAYGVGRVLLPTDMPTIRAIQREAAANGNTFSAIALGIVNSDSFRMRSAEPVALPKSLLAQIEPINTSKPTANH
jgi:hypothetical protein